MAPNFRVVTAEELGAVLDVLNGLSWPVVFEDFPAIFERLSWGVQHKGGGVTSLPVSKRMVSLGKLDDELSQVRFRVTDTLDEAGPASDATLNDAFASVSEVISECMGFAPTGTPWVTQGLVWDLPDGRQVRALIGEKTIELVYWSERMADIERHEWSHGVDPFNNLADREPEQEQEPEQEPEQALEARVQESSGMRLPMDFEDYYVSKEHRFSLGKENAGRTFYLSFPVSNGLVDYEECYALSPAEFEQFTTDPARAHPLLEQCRQHKQDDRLIQEPGSNRGTPV